MSEMPDVIRRAMEAQGKYDPDEALAVADVSIPDDVTETLAERIEQQPELPVGFVCHRCTEPLETTTGMLTEVVGYAVERKGGGQNHVIARRPTGRVLCGPCGQRLRIGLDEADQLTLGEAS